jgi:hypothetical protein
MPVKARRGYLLVEALCALALGGVLAAASAAVLSSMRVAISRLDSRIEAERVSREALGVATAILRSSDSVVVLGDTAVDLTLLIGSGVSCGSDSVELWLAPSRTADATALTSWSQLPDVGDEIAMLTPDTVTGLHRWVGETIDGSVTRLPATPCDEGNGWIAAGDAIARMHVLTLRTAIPASPGLPVRISRRGRLAVYVDGRGEWMLGWRRCLMAACGVIQPVAGPLRTPASGGFRVIGPDGDGILEVAVHAVGAPTPMVARLPRRDAW